jgi:UDP-N-acetylglucosamine 2-epimerase (non-hydrolysing)/GDP/UDP-N,N'-diacetylbacillosamine 2-epimerase (hydrolysing)
VKRRKIAVVTSSRADYGHLYWPLKELAARPSVEPRLIAMGPHLSPEFGHTVAEIERDGFAVDERVECLLSSDTDVGMAKTIGVATLGLADVLARLRPDILLLIADRYEMLAPAAAALALRIPVAHIEGGEVTEGAIDDAVRNALTKLSHLHLTTTEAARRRVLAMGEETWRVHRVGSPSLDNLRRRELIPRDALGARLGLDLDRPTVVVTYHPATVERETTAEAGPLFSALEQLPQQLVFCYPNADAGSRAIVERADSFCRTRADAHLFVNLPHLTYWSLLACAELFVGNSSSGIMETPSLKLPAVNVGIRQAGRERARNVLDAEPNAESILAEVRRALAPAFRASLEGLTNPYGDGHSAERIAELLAEVPLGEKLFVKRAVPLEGVAWRHDPEAEGA